MSGLSSQLSAFKNRIRNGPSVAVRRAVTPRPVAAQEEDESHFRKEEPLDGLGVANGGSGVPGTPSSGVKRQKFDNGLFSGAHLSTRLHMAVEYVKQQDKPVTVANVEGYLSFDISNTLLSLLKEIDRIKYDEATNTLEYMSLHNIRSAEDLLNFLRLQPTFKGTSVKELRDGWSGCFEAIEALEEESKIIVLRAKKDNLPRSVWANFGGELGHVDDEFVELWKHIRIPDKDSLYQALVSNSLKPTGADPHDLKKKPQQQERKQKKARRGKITNTHMKGILKDYSQLV
ncbi:hypothetical protein PUMCH_000725 [Australozyma saopauloensis]|uniref:Transcription initiation factor IIE subunit beta n=1 Tax=Australozyma saopauloensis TaxID=291208 RepID=A0AAX4H5G2_9ASCO|nr:hypothetical protein PUMCH_000725 [[Candida] saopauloensis]